MHFLAPAGPNSVVAEGKLTRLGKKLVFSECVLTAGGKDIARAHGIAYVTDRKKVASGQRA
jgi:acyl-coenzyme A thioesterase PaaI-like protein